MIENKENKTGAEILEEYHNSINAFLSACEDIAKTGIIQLFLEKIADLPIIQDINGSIRSLNQEEKQRIIKLLSNMGEDL